VEWKCCWTREVISPAECPTITPDEADLLASQAGRLVGKCLECPRFSEDLQSLAASGSSLAPVLRVLATEVLAQKAKLDSMVDFLDSCNLEIQFLREIGGVLQTSLDLDEVLSVALTAITAGKGFGMNRAFLLLADKERRFLKGYMGVGPRDYQEAWEIWEEVGHDDLALRDMAKKFHETKFSEEKDKFCHLLEQLAVPLGDLGHICNRALQEQRPILVEGVHQEQGSAAQLLQVLGVDTVLIIPLVSRNRRIGVILADNFITRKAITAQDMKSMETLSIPVAFAIERASLYERLHDDLRQLTLANAKLQEQQELIIRMEKLALLGKITSSIAHNIRNPLMIIGGFARSLLKDIADDDGKKESLETIVREAKQLEHVLTETLAYANSIFPAMDQWDVNQLVGNVLREVQTKLDLDGVTLHLDLATDLPLVYLDYRQLAYCLRKIVRSSLEAMVAPGELQITTRREAETILVELCDSVFRACEHDPGAALPVSLAARDDTEDMDLSFCRVILENYCDSFTVEEQGRGRRYTLRLPVKKEDSSHE
jgi:signal transduction histidine kinase